MCGAPVARHPLVRHPAEQQYADRFRLIDGKLLKFVAPHIFMPVDVPALWTLEEAVECHHIPHDEFSVCQDTPSRFIVVGGTKEPNGSRTRRSRRAVDTTPGCAPTLRFLSFSVRARAGSSSNGFRHPRPGDAPRLHESS